MLYRHQSTGVNGLKVREQGSTWSFVRSFGLFSARRGDNFLTMLPEFPIVACRDPLLEPCSGDADSLLLNIRVKCLSFRAKPAHISGHLPLTSRRDPLRAGTPPGRGVHPHMRQDKHRFPLITCRYAAIGSPTCVLALQRESLSIAAGGSCCHFLRRGRSA